ncbi:SSI family serine proteinase inhibitor [Streptomyces sp. YS-3]|uniref:SSI family serine proteinase inhibitor n=1 Tax=Streptomyces sp. YS-3 TaxID=3381352 RepID=UPI0038629A3B
MAHLSPAAKAPHRPPVVLVALALAAALAPGPAHAAPTGNWLQLSTTTGDSHTSSTRGTLLQCTPTLQGHHARAALACAQLDSVDGDIREIRELREGPQQDIPCDLNYGPVTAEARGQWNGRPVHYRETFANQCDMHAQTGAVFALDKPAVPFRPAATPGPLPFAGGRRGALAW